MTTDSMKVERIEVFTRWCGFADPPSHEAKLVMVRSQTGYLRESHPNGEKDEIPIASVQQLLIALSRPLEVQLNPELFDLPDSIIQSHYDSLWTDDYPAHLIRITLSNGRSVEIRTDSQHAFMLPLRISGSAPIMPGETFGPRLSQALAALMPEDYLERPRLNGQLGMLEWDLEQSVQGAEPSLENESDSPVPELHSEAPTEESPSDAIFRILNRQESVKEKLEAERTGQPSQRLLKRISLQDVGELLGDGADPSVADDAGQTALMHAAFPPFDKERFWLLANAGADLEARREDGLTGLQLACAGGEAKAAAAWVKAGANVNARTPEEATPLMMAASWPQIVRMLVDAGADVNAVDHDGHSALIYAILQDVWKPERLESIRELINAGTDLSTRDQDGVSALDHAHRMVAQVRLSEEVCQEMRKHDDSPNMSDHELKIAEAVVNLLASADSVD